MPDFSSPGWRNHFSIPYAPLQRLGIVVILVFALVTVTLAMYGVPRGLSPEGEKAFRLLQRTEIFCNAHVGIGGNLPDTVQALRQLYSEEQADAAFKKLLANSTMSGKLYALCGLYYTDYNAFLREIQRYRQVQTKVETFRACRMGSQSVAELIEDRSPSTVRLLGPKETLKDWQKRQQIRGYQVDILGGGWQEMLMRSPEDDSMVRPEPKPQYIVNTESLIRRPPLFNRIFP